MKSKVSERVMRCTIRKTGKTSGSGSTKEEFGEEKFWQNTADRKSVPNGIINTCMRYGGRKIRRRYSVLNHEWKQRKDAINDLSSIVTFAIIIIHRMRNNANVARKQVKDAPKQRRVGCEFSHQCIYFCATRQLNIHYIQPSPKNYKNLLSHSLSDNYV